MFSVGPSAIFFHDHRPAAAPSGVPVLLVHGFPLDSRIWHDCSIALRNALPDRRIVVPDMPGFGRSTTTAAFTMATLADDLAALMAQLGEPRFVIAGLSMGGYVSLTLAKRNPGVLAGVLMVDSKAAADDDTGKAARNKMADSARTQGSGAVAETMMPRMLHASAYASRPDLVASLDAIMRSQSPVTIANACEALRDRDDFVAMLPSLPVPFGAIVGSGDVIAPVAVAASMVQSRGTMYVVEGAGHLAPFEKPVETARAIAAFLHQHQL